MVGFRASVALGIVFVFASSIGYTATGNTTGTVEVVLIDDADYGGCMAYLSTDINSVLPACSSGWVTLDCLAVFPETTKSQAQSKLSTAQLALATGKQIRVYATDARKANGYCLATRIDLLR